MELDLRAILEADSRLRRKMIDVIAKRFLGRDPARRRVRLTQIAAIFQLAHHVANHRGAHAELMMRDDLRGPDRRRSRDELLHRREQQRVTPGRKRVMCGVGTHLPQFCSRSSVRFKPPSNDYPQRDIEMAAQYPVK